MDGMHKRSAPSRQRSHRLGGGIVQVVGRYDVDAAFLQDALASLDIGALEPDDEGHSHLDLQAPLKGSVSRLHIVEEVHDDVGPLRNAAYRFGRCNDA